MTTLDDHSNTIKKVFYPLVAALGIGCLFQVPLIALQAAMPLRDMATSTGTFGFLRTMGGTVGIAVGQTLYTSILKRKINRIPGLSGFDTSPAGLSDSVRTLHTLPQPQRGEIIHAFTKSIAAIWVFNTPLVGIGFIMVLFIKAYSLKRITIQSGARASTDVEAATGEKTPSNGAPAESDEKSERREATLSVDSKDRDHTPGDNADMNPHGIVSEKV